MDQFSYLSVLLSIILGLGITQVLKGFRGIVLSRSRVRMYWPVLLWAVGLLGMCFQAWWAMFGLREIAEWTFAHYAVILLQTVFTYMLAALVFPDFVGDETVDLRSHYFAHTRWFFGLFIAVLIASLTKDLVINGHLPERTNVGFHVVFIAAFLIAALTRREWYHKALSLTGIVAFIAYTMLLFFAPEMMMLVDALRCVARRWRFVRPRHDPDFAALHPGYCADYRSSNPWATMEFT